MNLLNRAFIKAFGQQPTESMAVAATQSQAAQTQAEIVPAASGYGFYRLELPAPPVLFEGESGVGQAAPAEQRKEQPRAPQPRTEGLSTAEIESLVAVLQQQVAGLQTTAAMVNKLAIGRQPETTAPPQPAAKQPVAPVPEPAPVAAAPTAPPAPKPVPPAAPRKPQPVAAAPVTPPAPAPPAKAEFRPVWEVERYLWPAILDRLIATGDFSSACAALRQAIREGRSAVGVTSISRGEGRTLIALCLAREAAALGLKVALVDADAGSARLAGCMGMEEVCGWEELAAGEIPLAECAITAAQEQITLVPLRRQAATRGFSITRGRLAHLVQELSASHDLVLLDCGPLSEPSTETECLAALPAALLVADCHRTTNKQLQDAASRLKQLGVSLLGVVQNFLSSDASN